MIEVYDIEPNKKSPIRYSRLFSKAESDSQEFDAVRQEFLEYTFPAYSGARNQAESLGKKFSIDLYDSTTLESANGMSQYIKATLTPDWKTWAKISPSIEDDRYKTQLDVVYDRINEMLFSFLNNSNFSQESGVAINNLVGCGTGALKILEGDIETPFSFSFVPLKNLSILEGVSGNIEKVFYRHIDMTIEKIMGTWNIEAKDIEETFNETDEDFDWDKEFDVIETCIYLGKYTNKKTGLYEDVFHYLISDTGFTKIYKEEYLDYNPFIVVRWNKRDDKTSWGHPIIADILPNVKTLNEAVKHELLAGERAVNPPVFLKNASSMKGSFKLENGTAYYVPMGADVLPVHLTGNFNLSLIKTQELKDSIKNAFINLDSVFATDKNTYKTAEEVARQHYEFTKRYSTVYGKIEKEYLSPILTSCFAIMRRFGLFPNLEPETKEEAEMFFDMMTKMKVFYINPLKLSEDRDKIQVLMDFLSITGNVLGAETAQMLINPPKFLEKLKLYTDIDRSLLRTETEFQQVMQQQAEMQQKMAEQMNGGAESEGQNGKVVHDEQQ